MTRICISDDDSEPILGQWFEETISVPDMEASSAGQNGNNNQDGNKAVNAEGPNAIVPEKGEPNGVGTAGVLMSILPVIWH